MARVNRPSVAPPKPVEPRPSKKTATAVHDKLAGDFSRVLKQRHELSKKTDGGSPEKNVGLEKKTVKVAEKAPLELPGKATKQTPFNKPALKSPAARAESYDADAKSRRRNSDLGDTTSIAAFNQETNWSLDGYAFSTESHWAPASAERRLDATVETFMQEFQKLYDSKDKRHWRLKLSTDDSTSLDIELTQNESGDWSVRVSMPDDQQGPESDILANKLKQRLREFDAKLELQSQRHLT